MAKRISREEFDHLMDVANAACLSDIEAANGDIGKMSVADKKYDWAVEAAKEALGRKSGLYRFFESIPLIGKPVAIILENIENGVAEHGVVLGAARGLLIGITLAVALVVVTEAFAFAFDLGRNWLQLHWGSNLKKAQIEKAVAAAFAEGEATLMHRGPTPLKVARRVTCYPADEDRFPSQLAERSNAKNVADLRQFDPKLLDSSRTLDQGARVFVYVHHIPDRNTSIPLLDSLVNVPNPFSHPAHDEPAIIIGPNGTKYVPVLKGQQVMLIRADDLTNLAPTADVADSGPPGTRFSGTTATAPHSAAPSPVSSSTLAGHDAAPTEASTPAALKAVTLSPNVPFVQVDAEEFLRATTNDEAAQHMAKYFDFRESGAPVSDKLPQGTPYAPYLKDRFDPTSTVTIRRADGPSGILATTPNRFDYPMTIILPESEYKLFRQSQGVDARNPR